MTASRRPPVFIARRDNESTFDNAPTHMSGFGQKPIEVAAIENSRRDRATKMIELWNMFRMKRT